MPKAKISFSVQEVDNGYIFNAWKDGSEGVEPINIQRVILHPEDLVNACKGVLDL